MDCWRSIEKPKRKRPLNLSGRFVFWNQSLSTVTADLVGIELGQFLNREWFLNRVTC